MSKVKKRGSTVLLKALLFKELTKYEPVYCYRCGVQLSLDDFTIDHKVRHEGDMNLWSDVDNVAYSHFQCNAKANGANEKRWVTNGFINQMLPKHLPLRNGWWEGRVQGKTGKQKNPRTPEHSQKLGSYSKGRSWTKDPDSGKRIWL